MYYYDDSYYNNDYLQHYGVLGMKWGIRRRRRQDAKAAYRKTTDKAFAKYEKGINAIEKNYKKGQRLSKADIAKQNKLEADFAAAQKQAKKDYKVAKKDKSKDVAIANKLYSKQSKGANERVAKMSTGKALAQSYLMGSYGALAYNSARADGLSRGQSAVAGVIVNVGNNLTGQLAGNAHYLVNRSARKKK